MEEEGISGKRDNWEIFAEVQRRDAATDCLCASKIHAKSNPQLWQDG